MEDDLLKHFEETDRINKVEVSVLDEDIVSANIMKAFLNVQKDRLDSENGRDTGEVDIMLCENGNPVVIMEGLKLGSFEREKLDTHINKALSDYDPNGCPMVCILIYATVKGFGDFWEKVMNHMSGYTFPYETVE